jgi:hypothetical protein
MQKQHIQNICLKYQHYIPYLEILAMFSCLGNLFTYYQQIRDDRFYGAVKLIGTKSEASRYKSEYNLLAENGIEQISDTF